MGMGNFERFYGKIVSSYCSKAILPFKACKQYHQQNFGLKPYSKYTKDMYNVILGSGSEVGLYIVVTCIQV